MTRKVLIVSRIQAEHSLATEFNEQLESMLDRREHVVSKLAEAGRLVVSQMGKEYDYAVKDASTEPFLPEEVKRASPIRVVRRWVNKDKWVRVASLYGISVGQDEPEVVVSHVYYWQNGMLLYWMGSGKMLLKANVQCSETEWLRLRRGMVKPMLAA